jgi:hypothetical protein
VAGSFDQYWCKTNPGAAGCTPSNPTSTTVSTGGTTGNPTSTTVSTGGTTGNPTSTTGGTGGTPTTVATGGTPGSPGNPVVTGTGGGPGGPKGPTNCGGAGVNCVPSLTSGPGNPIPKPVNQPSKGPVIVLANLSFPIVVGPKRIWRDGGWRSFVPFDALDVVRVDNGYYYPSAYVSVGRSYCGGRTPEGCHLNWQTVSFAGGGGSAFQCVQFCPRPGRPPPPRFTALAPPPPVPPSGRCEVAIFADPGFGGASSPATADQPNLGEVGWKDQIGSLQVKAGVWDFFGDDQFQGESMRLQPGQYPQLSPEFTKHIGSFMCVQGT